MEQAWIKRCQEKYIESERANLTQEGLSDLAGDSMILSGSESPTESPFRLDAIICSSTPNGQLIYRAIIFRGGIDRSFNTVPQASKSQSI